MPRDTKAPPGGENGQGSDSGVLAGNHNGPSRNGAKVQRVAQIRATPRWRENERLSDERYLRLAKILCRSERLAQARDLEAAAARTEAAADRYSDKTAGTLGALAYAYRRRAAILKGAHA